MIRSLFALTWFATVVAPLSARDIFVNNVTGDDTRDGSSAEQGDGRAGPCRTIVRALKLARGNDRIVLANSGEPYHETLTFQAARHSGLSSQQPFELVGNGAILDGTQSIPPNRWEHVRGGVYRYLPNRSSFQVLYQSGKPAVRRPVAPGAGLPALEPLEWCLYERHLYFCVEPGKNPIEYSLSCAELTVGITLYEVRNLVIRDLVVQGFQLDGVNAHDGVTGGIFRGLTCRGNGRSGISIGGASRVRVENCIAGDNGAAQIRVEGNCRAELVGCELIDNTAPGLVREGGQVLVAEARE